MVAQLTVNQLVAGSNPAARAIYRLVSFSIYWTKRVFVLSLPWFAISVPAADLLIVSPPELTSSWEFYAESRRNATGKVVQVVGTDLVYAQHPFGEGQACRNAAESLHAYLRAAHAGGTTNFLLGGAWIDATKTDAPIFLLTGERLSLANAVSGICMRPHGTTGLESAPSDMFYACLDVAEGSRPWDSDGDGVYLGANERTLCDLEADVVVGRFPALPFAYGDGPVLSAAQLVTNYAAKVARGESASFAGRHRLGMVGATQVNQAPAGDSALGFRGEMQFFDGVPNVWQPTHLSQVSDGESVLRETLHSLVLPKWPTTEIVSLYYADGPSVSWRHADLAAARDELLADDLLAVCCRTHGHVQIALNEGGRSWLTRSLYARAEGLALFAEFGVPCRCGMVDYTTVSNGVVYAVPSLGAAMVVSPLGGAVTGVFNSRDGISTFTTPYSLYDGLSNSLASLLMEELFGGEGVAFGEALRLARRRYCRQSGPGRSADCVYALGEQFFLGDPTLGLPAVVKTWSSNDAHIQVDGDRVWTRVELSAADVDIASPGKFRVMDTLTHVGTNLVLTVGGGIGRGVLFAGPQPGVLTLADDVDCYVGGVSNCARVVVSGGRKTLRCVDRDRRFAGTLEVDGGTLVLETAESLRDGEGPLARVVDGTLEWAVSPHVGRADGGEHLVRALQLDGGRLLVQKGSGLAWGRADAPFRLQVSGSCSVESVSPVRLAGTTTIELDEDSELELHAELTAETAGRLVLTGPGTVWCSSERALAGQVEVRSGTALMLEAAPLPGVTDLVVRAGAVLGLPASASGRHPLVPKGGCLVIEEGALVVDLAGGELTGKVADGTFFEASTALRWKGGAGAWSDADGWFDYVTGAFVPWREGSTAVFDAPQGSVVTNDGAEVQVAGMVFGADAEFHGGAIRCASGELLVPTAATVALAAPLAVSGDVVKLGEGKLELVGVQSGLGPGALRTQAGTLALTGCVAPGVTNLVVANGARLELSGINEMTQAVTRASIATNALVRAGTESATLALAVFTPSKPLLVPEGVTIDVRGPIADDGGRTWTAQVDGMIDYHGILSGVYGVLDGSGTVRVEGLRSRSGSGVGFGECRLEWVGDDDGRFPFLGFNGRNLAFVVLDGTTVAPQGNEVVAGAAGVEGSYAALYVEGNGCTFEVGTGKSLVLGDDEDSLLFGGPGEVVKTGAGTLWLPIPDQHTGRTWVREGTYALGGGTLSQSFELGSEGVLEFAGAVPTGLRATNFVWSAGAAVRLGVRSGGADLLDLRGCTLPSDDDALRIEVQVAPDAPAGFHALLRADDVRDPKWRRLEFEIEGVRGRSAKFAVSQDHALYGVLLGPPGIVLLLR